MRKIIGVYVIILGTSGIGVVLGLAWIISHISDFKVVNNSIFSYLFIINMYIFGGLLILGLVGVIVYFVDGVFKYIAKNR